MCSFWSEIYKHISASKTQKGLVLRSSEEGRKKYGLGWISACNAEDIGGADLIPRLGRSPRGGYGNPLQYSEKPGGLQSIELQHDWSDWACMEQPALVGFTVLRSEWREAGWEVMREDVPHFRLCSSVLSFSGGVLVSPSVLGTVVQLPLFFCDYESKTAVWSAPLLLFPLRNTTTRDQSWDSPPCLFRLLN